MKRSKLKPLAVSVMLSAVFALSPVGTIASYAAQGNSGGIDKTVKAADGGGTVSADQQRTDTGDIAGTGQQNTNGSDSGTGTGSPGTGSENSGAAVSTDQQNANDGDSGTDAGSQKAGSENGGAAADTGLQKTSGDTGISADSQETNGGDGAGTAQGQSGVDNGASSGSPAASVNDTETGAASTEDNATDTTVFTYSETIKADNSDLADSDTLLEQYVDKQLTSSSGSGSSAASGIGRIIRRAPRRNRFSGANAKLYDKLQTTITAVANGTESSAQIELKISDLSDQTTFTKSELGLGDDPTKSEVVAALLTQISFNFSSVYDALLDDLPYDLYWLDKTQATTASISGNFDLSDGVYSFGEKDGKGGLKITFSFPVSADYSSSGTTGTYTTNANKIKAAIAAAVNAKEIAKGAAEAAINAKQIVSGATGATDFEILTYFKNKICELVSYDSTVANNSSANYGDPWQLIYVFDNDSTTNVVCEGYAKAFKYLCDLYKSEKGFSDPELDVYLVTGTMSGGTGAGIHMWNVVQTSGETYLVDITNSDEGTAGADGSLFMIPISSLTNIKRNAEGRITGYTAGNVTYSYDNNEVNDMLSQYDEDEIGIAVAVTGITATADSTSLTVGDTTAVTAVIAPDDATNKNVTWSSTNEKVATVDENGRVTAVSAGTAVITAAAQDGSGKTGTCTITVRSGSYAASVRYGAGKTAYVKGTNEGLSVVSDGDSDKFVGICVDGKELSADKYSYALEISENTENTLFTLYAGYLNTLSDGKHEIVILFTDGKAAATINIVSDSTDGTGSDGNAGSADKTQSEGSAGSKVKSSAGSKTAFTSSSKSSSKSSSASGSRTKNAENTSGESGDVNTGDSAQAAVWICAAVAAAAIIAALLILRRREKRGE